MFNDLWAELVRSLTPVFSDYRGRLPSLSVSQKTDATVLTEADLSVEAMIIDNIRAFDPTAVIIAEESGLSPARLDSGSTLRHWVIDPIDGTAEFIQPTRTEFCSVVCVLENREPVAAFVFAPELGLDGQPLAIIADRREGSVRINTREVSGQRGPSRPETRRASVTRSASSPARPFEEDLIQAGYTLKTRTTSQTLDMVRTAVDIAAVSRDALAPFDVFYRENQKIWDGLAGLCLGMTMGLAATDRDGGPRLPVSPLILQQADPEFDSTLMAAPEALTWILEKTRANN